MSKGLEVSRVGCSRGVRLLLIGYGVGFALEIPGMRTVLLELGIFEWGKGAESGKEQGVAMLDHMASLF